MSLRTVYSVIFTSFSVYPYGCFSWRGKKERMEGMNEGEKWMENKMIILKHDYTVVDSSRIREFSERCLHIL